MRIRTFHWGCLAACLAVALPALPALAQEGHPLTGTWSGDWGPGLEERTHVTLIVEYDGDRLTGLLNPGPDAVELSGIALDVTDWTVRLRADGPGGAIAAEGRIEDIESYHRTLEGTWSQGGVEGDFLLTRD